MAQGISTLCSRCNGINCVNMPVMALMVLLPASHGSVDIGTR